MQPPAALIKQRRRSLPCIGDGRQSGTSGTPSILNASPEAAAGGGLAPCCRPATASASISTRARADILLSPRSWTKRRAELEAQGGYAYPASQTPWQEIQRAMVDQLSDGMVLKPAVKYQKRRAELRACRATISSDRKGGAVMRDRLQRQDSALVTRGGAGASGRAIAEALSRAKAPRSGRRISMSRSSKG